MNPKNLFGISYLDPPRGKTKELINKLIELKKWGKNEGGDEMIAVLDLLSNLEKHPYLNSLVLKNSPIWNLIREFAQAFFPSPPPENELVRYMVSKHQWKELPVYAVGFSNATNALTASLQAHGVAGGEVITTSYNYLAAPNAIVQAGGKPRFVDINPKTYCIDLTAALKAVNKNTRAILVTHVNQAIDLFSLIKGLEGRGNIALIQDGTCGLGSNRGGVGVGQINPPPNGVSVFSLGPTKLISGLGGALIVSQDYDFLRRIEALSFHGLEPPNYEEIRAFGNNYKMNEIACVIAMEQLKKRDRLIAKRKKLKTMYDEAFKPLIEKGEVTLQQLPEGSLTTHYMVQTKKSSHQVITKLSQQFKIGASRWWAFHLEPVYRLQFGLVSLPVTEALSDKIIFLPFHVDLEKENVKRIVQSLEAVLSEP